MGKVHSQSKSIQQSTRQTIEVSMTSWTGPARTQTCIHMSNSTSSRGATEGHIMPFIPDGEACHMNASASEAESVLQMSIYDREKKAWNWKKYVA